MVDLAGGAATCNVNTFISTFLLTAVSDPNHTLLHPDAAWECTLEKAHLQAVCLASWSMVSKVTVISSTHNRDRERQCREGLGGQAVDACGKGTSLVPHGWQVRKMTSCLIFTSV